MAPSYSGVWKTQTIYQYINDNFGKSFQSASLGSEAVFEDSTTEFPDVCFDSTNNRIVVAYFDDADSDKGKAAVGTVSSDGSISFGTPVVFESGAALEGNSGKISIVHDSNADRVAIFYTDASNSYYGTAAIGTVDSSDNSISFGTPVVFSSGATYLSASVFDSNANKTVTAFYDSSDDGAAIVGTVSGTSISFGTAADFQTNPPNYISIAFDSTNNKVVIAHQDSANGDGKGEALVGTVSGTSISFGSITEFEQGETRYTATTYDTSNEKIVIAYHDNGNSAYGTAIVGTVSGTSISFGTPVVFQSSGNYGVAATFDTNSNKVIISYRDYDNSKSRIIEGTVSGTSISFGSSTILNNAAVQQYDLNNAIDSNVNKTISVYRDDGNSNYGAAIAYTSEGYYV